jgi:RNA polymerase sigma-70 factor (ECF subfamily)
MSDASTQLQFWIDRLQAGDEQARQEVLNFAAERLRRLVRKMLKDYPGVGRWEQSDDVLQNTVVRLSRALREVRPPTVRDFFRLAAWHIRRELIDLARHYYGPEGLGAHHATHTPDRAGDGPAPPAPEATDESHDPGRLVGWGEFHRQIESLPEPEREVVDLLWYQGLSQAEAARLLGVTERTVKRRWAAARLKLHEALHGERPDR